MRCEEAQGLITSLVDNELLDHGRYSIEAHLEDCPRCLLIYDQGLNLKNAIRSVGASVKAPADLKKRILSDRRISGERETLAKKGKDHSSL